MSYDFDPLARLSSRTIATTTPFTTTYTYLDGTGSHSTTTLLASLTNGSNPAYSYTVDANGNILTISEGATLKASYTYDTMNQLIREDSAYASKSFDYVYDVGGNLTSKTIYTFTGGVRGALEDSIVYLYENAWKDQLSSYDGQLITYDAIGNPLSYRNGLSFTWANGRELAGVTNNGVTGTFTYNDSGIRTSKTYNGVTTSYLLNGSSIVRQTQGESTLDFFYDENGNLYGFQKGTSTYYYLRNGQNDIVGILDSTGTQVVSYTSDAWGNPLSVTGSLATTIGVENPFRYRGYYFDTETGLYYLNSRYYDSVTGRFISADSIFDFRNILSINLYAYCNNNPVRFQDSSGHIFFEAVGELLSSGVLIYQVIGGVISGEFTMDDVISDIKNYDHNNADTNKVKDAKIFSSYRGVLVIKQDYIVSCTYGKTIYLNSGVNNNIIKHEYGHAVQEQKLGEFVYTLGIAVPSVKYHQIDKEKNLGNNLYYSMPWERSADYFGGVNRDSEYYYKGSLELSLDYFHILEAIGKVASHLGY